MEIGPSKFPFSHEDSLLFIGSCFSEHIANGLKDRLWNVQAMPNGIVFNPLSLLEPLERILNSQDYTENDLVFHQGLWHGKYHHGSFSQINVSDTLRAMNHSLHEFKRSLGRASHLFVTFGTSFAYRYLSSNETFANCHKIPQDQFEKYLVKDHEIIQRWSALLERWNAKYPDMKVVFTVSPVKHLKDGVIENSRSKSILLHSVHELVERFNFTEYFPAYELIVDDLRDYRFYESDGAHPSHQAIRHVFDKFCECFLDDPGKAYLKDMNEYLSLSRHKLMRQDGEEAIKYNKKLEEVRQKISSIYGVEV